MCLMCSFTKYYVGISVLLFFLSWFSTESTVNAVAKRVIRPNRLIGKSKEIWSGILLAMLKTKINLNFHNDEIWVQFCLRHDGNCEGI